MGDALDFGLGIETKLQMWPKLYRNKCSVNYLTRWDASLRVGFPSP